MPALMLQPSDPLAAKWGLPLAAAYAFGKAVLGMLLLGIAAIGFFRRPTPWWERIYAGLTAALLLVVAPWTDEIGFVLAAIFFAQHIQRARAAALPAA
jgi:TRAP-type uncharacterized transport system fused permease subunit